MRSWFEGARLNYAEHALRPGLLRHDDVAVVAVSQSRDRVSADLGGARRSGRLAPASGCSGSASWQVTACAAYLPNIPETLVAFLAAASLGATWTSCAPEFGVQAVLDRFAQVEPTVLFAVEGYQLRPSTGVAQSPSWRRFGLACRACGRRSSCRTPIVPRRRA